MSKLGAACKTSEVPHKSKQIDSRYDDEALEEAVRLVGAGSLSLRKAAARFSIPRSTISDHASVKSVNKPGRKSVLPPDVVTKVLNLADQGFGLTHHQLMMKAGEVHKMFLHKKM